VENGRPDSRRILCLVGECDGQEAVEVPEHDNLFFGLPLEGTVKLGERLYKIRLKVRIRPSGLEQLDLQDPRIKESFVKEFYLDINMQEGTGT
jgi:hypothetical protein